MTRGTFSPERAAFLQGVVKRVLWQAQGGKCHLCGQAIPQKWRSPKLTFDHLWPVSRIAGANSFEGNIMLAHEKCNQVKDNRRPRPCELLFLSAVNRRIGFRESETAIWERL